MKKSTKFLERANSHLIWVINVLCEDGVKKDKECKKIQSDLNISNARIVDLQKDVDAKSASSTPHQFFRDKKETYDINKLNMIIIDKATGVEYSLNRNIFKNLLGVGQKFLQKWEKDIEEESPQEWADRMTEYTVGIHGAKIREDALIKKDISGWKDMSAYEVAKHSDKIVKSFANRFMPNVKFSNKKEFIKNMNPDDFFIYINSKIVNLLDGHFITDSDSKGLTYGNMVDSNYDGISIPEVSIYEAIPELVPEGMFYDKDSDALVKVWKKVDNGKNHIAYDGTAFDTMEEVYEHEKAILNRKEFGTDYHPDDVAFKAKVVSLCVSCGKKDSCSLLSKFNGHSAITDCFEYQMENDSWKNYDFKSLLRLGDPTKHNPISSLAKELAKSKPFNCSEVQWVIDTFGEDRVSNILDMLCACGLKLSDIEPLKK